MFGGAGRNFFRRLCDRLHGGEGNDRSSEAPAATGCPAGRATTSRRAARGDDLIFANRGVDRSYGGDGADELWALSRYDVTALGDPVGDELHGGDGADRFRVRDGEVDTVHCGDGRDSVLADQYDQVDTDCEASAQGAGDLAGPGRGRPREPRRGARGGRRRGLRPSDGAPDNRGPVARLAFR